MAKISRYFIGLGFLLLVSCASQTGTESLAEETVSSQSSVADAADSGSDPDEMICRREQVTGSNFRRKVCMTRSQREQRRQETQEAVLNNRNATLGGGIAQ